MTRLPRILVILIVMLGTSLSQGADRAGSQSGANNNNNSGNSGSNINAGGQNSRSLVSAPVSVVTDPAYKLSVGDQITVQLYDESQLNCNQLIDSKGIARLTEIGETKLTGLTVREAEYLIEKLYKERDILKRPAVTLTVTGFTPREVLVMGGVNSPGAIPFAQDATSMPIVMAIIRAGNFKLGAKQNTVTVRRKNSNGLDVTLTVDVESMLSTNRRRPNQAPDSFPVYPGDLITVDMSIF